MDWNIFEFNDVPGDGEKRKVRGVCITRRMGLNLFCVPSPPGLQLKKSVYLCYPFRFHHTTQYLVDTTTLTDPTK